VADHHHPCPGAQPLDHVDDLRGLPYAGAAVGSSRSTTWARRAATGDRHLLALTARQRSTSARTSTIVTARLLQQLVERRSMSISSSDRSTSPDPGATSSRPEE